MNLRLTFELLLRRHGAPGLFVVIVAAMLLMASLGFLQPPPALPAETVMAVDGAQLFEARQHAFRRLLLTPPALEKQQGEILALAARHGLAVGRIDFGTEQLPAGSFSLASLQMSARGNYVDFRRFLDEAMAAHSAAALEALDVQHNADGNGIEARLKLAFHVAPQALTHAGEALPTIRILRSRESGADRGSDPFNMQTALPVHAAEEIAAVPSAPTFSAPLPFRVIGKQSEEDGGWSVFMARGEETWVVREGDALGDDYRVASIRPPQLALQHVRLKTRRTIDIGEAKE
jgi:hypothetical protein